MRFTKSAIMKTLHLLLIYCGLVTSIIAQPYQYSATFVAPCSNEEMKPLYRLERDSKKFYPNNKNVCTLPKAGTYLLYAGSNLPVDVITIDAQGLTEDTVQYQTVTESTSKSSGENLYWCCNKLCDGVQTIRYSNGAVRLEGTFKKGKLVDMFTSYYPNGQISKQINPVKSLETSYYDNGQLKKKVNTTTKSQVYYYPNGQLWTKSQRKGEATDELVQYYDNGKVYLEQKGKVRKVYYKNGQLAYKMKRSEPYWYSRWLEKSEFKFFVYDYKAYSKQGTLLTEAQFTGADFDYPQGFPKTLSEVPEKEIEHIVFYNKAGERVKKHQIAYITSKRYEKRTFVYESNKWKEVNAQVVNLSVR